MKEVWYKADEGEWEDRLPLVTAALESGVDKVLVGQNDIENVKELGEVDVAAFIKDQEKVDINPEVFVIGKDGEGDGTIDFPPDLSGSSDLAKLKSIDSGDVAGYIKLLDERYERLAAKLGEYADYIIIIGEDWEVIPLENLIAELQNEDVKIIAGVDSSEDAKTAFETLEIGADGVLLDTDDPSQIKKTIEIRDEMEAEEIDLELAEITKVEPTESGDRVCVDTTTLMDYGEGMLVGSSSSGLFLVHAEVEQSPYVASRPFRVNAGGVHSYIRVPEGETRYLSELKAGDKVLVVNKEGKTREALVGRSKIEKRPLMLIEAEIEGQRYKTLIQNAETIKLVTPDGTKAVTELKEGDEVFMYIEQVGRHFGKQVDESIVEK